jgi:hypothetical protein
MHCSDHLVVNRGSGPERIDAAYEGDGLRFEVDAVHRCLDEGQTEGDVMPLDGSVRLASKLDTIRDRIGLVYPTERPG